MRRVKSKVVGNAADVGSLKSQLAAVIKEIIAFSGKVEEMQQEKLQFGHCSTFLYQNRLDYLRSKLQAGRDPAKPVIFLTRMVIECLSKGPMSEKDMKTLVLDRCKEMGIKSSNRGLIAGTGMDVATVCSVLAALGVIEALDMNNSTVSNKNDADSAASAVAVKAESGSTCPTQITGAAAELYRILTERWQPKLDEYFEDALKSKLAAAAAAAAENAIGNTVIGTVSVESVVNGTAEDGSKAPIRKSDPMQGISTSATSSSSNGSQLSSLITSRSDPSAPPVSVKTTSIHSALKPAAGDGPSSSGGSTSLTTTTNTTSSTSVPLFPIFKNAPKPSSVDVPSSSGAASSASMSSSVVISTSSDPLAPSQKSSLLPISSQHPGQTSSALTQSSSNPSPSVPASPGFLSRVPPNGNLGVGGIQSSSSYNTLAELAKSTYGPTRQVSGLGGTVAPNNFLSTSAAMSNSTSATSAHSTTSGGSPLQVVPHASVRASQYTAAPSEAASCSSIQPALGNVMSISTPGAAGSSDLSTKPGKAKAPKAAKGPGEKKSSKRPVSKGSELISSAPSNSVAPVAAGVVAPASGTNPATTTIVKARRGPSAMRVWRLRVEYESFSVAFLQPEIKNEEGSVKHRDSPTTLISKIETTISEVPLENGGDCSGGSSSTNKNSAKRPKASCALSLLVNPSILEKTAFAEYEHQSALELEEKLLRRLAGQCSIVLKPSRYRIGTTYLSADPDAANQVVGSRYVRIGSSMPLPTYLNQTNAKNSSSSMTTADRSSSGGYEAAKEPNFALYDNTINITSSYLLDKIRRTKRQRGDCLYGTITLPHSSNASASVTAARNAAAASVGVYSSAHVHALSAVCQKTTEYYWGIGNPHGVSPRIQKSAKRPPVPATKGQNEPITMAQYAHNLHMGISSGLGAPIVLSSCSDGSSITLNTLRRYAQPNLLIGGDLPMLDASKATTIFAAATGGAHSSNSSGRTNFTASNNGSEVLRIPDLSLCTREIAWSEIAQEFSVLPAPVDEPGYIPGGVHSVSESEPQKSEKKRKYLQNQGKSAPIAGTLEDAAQHLASIEVLAPQYKEITPMWKIVLDAQQKLGSAAAKKYTHSSDSEDTSDEAVGSRHEAVLKKMRDKWNLLQQLKNEALYGVGGAPSDGDVPRAGGGYRSAGSTGGGYGGFFGVRSASGAFSSASTQQPTPSPAAQAGAVSGPAGTEVSHLSPLLGSPSDQGPVLLNLSPRKRGLASAHAKRRGRPPKIAKIAHHHHLSPLPSIPAAFQSTPALSDDNGSAMDIGKSDDAANGDRGEINT